jgi:amidase
VIPISEYRGLDATDMSALIQAGDLSATQLLESAIARMSQVNLAINAIVIPMLEHARERAGAAPQGPFGGVPFLLKDLFQDFAGVPSSCGNQGLKRTGYTPKAHAEIVKRWLAAGTVMFGRTNTPEFGSKGITEPVAWGPTRNPWSLEHSPGGSSGGAAAAVAARIVPMAAASDGGGSIRIPASFTGLFGFKPGRGRTPSGPGVTDPMHGASVNHVLTRSVRDSARMLDATHGPERGGGFRLASPPRPYAEELERDPGPLRIAFSARSPIGSDVHPDAVAAVERAAALLASLGHHVEEAAPEIDGMALAMDFCAVWFAQLAHHVAHTRQLVAATDRDFELDSLALSAIARARSGPEYVARYTSWGQHADVLAGFLGRYDVFLTPTTAAPPPRIGEVKTPAWAERALRLGLPLGLGRLLPLAQGTVDEVTFQNLRVVPFTQLANVTGVPAMSVPLAQYRDGLPLGVQLLADHGGEGLLFSIAAQLERASPWQQRLPTLP